MTTKLTFFLKTEIEIVTKEDDIENIIQTIITKAQTGDIGDGKIFISHVEEVIRIRTGERGEKAV